MKLSEIPLDTLKIGDRCISAIGTMGDITVVDTSSGVHGRGIGWLKIEWENGNTSECWYDDGDCGTWYWENVTYIGQLNDSG
jgi:hypothetical protein